MATNFPSSLDTSTQQPTISSTDEMDDSGKEHDVVHTNHSGAIIALETKLGTGDSNATANAVLIGTGSGTSGWDTSPTFKDAVTIEDDTPVLTVADTGNNYAQDDVQCTIHMSGRYHSGTADPLADAYSDAKIQLFKDNSDGSGGSGLSFWTSADGVGGLTRALTINSGGELVLGAETTNGPKLYDGGSDDLMVNTGDGTCSVGPKSTSGNHFYTSLVRHYFGLYNVAEYVMSPTSFYPYNDNHQDCGASSYRWDDIRATNGSIQTSDQRDKTTVTNIDLGLSFIDSLRPVTYKWDDRSGYTGTRTHMGFIAQEVATALGNKATGRALWTNDEAGTDVNDMGDEVQTVERQGLRYTELLAPLVKAVQELSARVTALEG